MADIERQEQNMPWLTPSSTPLNSDTTSRTILDNNNVNSDLKEAKTDSTMQPPQDPRLKREIRRMTLNFTPSWFSVNMGTGITSILLHQLPFQFNGLGIISNVIFGLNVFLFLIFFGISLARYTIWPNMF